MDFDPPTHCYQPDHHGSVRRAGSAAPGHSPHACHLRAVTHAQNQRNSAAAVFPRAELYCAESRADLLLLQPPVVPIQWNYAAWTSATEHFITALKAQKFTNPVSGYAVILMGIASPMTTNILATGGASLMTKALSSPVK